MSPARRAPARPPQRLRDRGRTASPARDDRAGHQLRRRGPAPDRTAALCVRRVPHTHRRQRRHRRDQRPACSRAGRGDIRERHEGTLGRQVASTPHRRTLASPCRTPLNDTISRYETLLLSIDHFPVPLGDVTTAATKFMTDYGIASYDASTPPARSAPAPRRSSRSTPASRCCPRPSSACTPTGRGWRPAGRNGAGEPVCPAARAFSRCSRTHSSDATNREIGQRSFM